MLAYTDDHQAYVRDRQTTDYVTLLPEETAFCLAFSPDDEYLACGCWSNLVTVWNIESAAGKLRASRAWTRCSQYVFLTQRSSAIERNQKRTKSSIGVISIGSRIAWPSTVRGSVPSRSPAIWDTLRPSAMKRSLASRKSDSRQRVAEFTTLRGKQNLSGPQKVAVDFDPTTDNLTLAALAKGEVVIWTGPNRPLRKLKPQFEDEDSHLRSLQYSPEGRFLVAGDSDGTLWFWDTDTWNMQSWNYGDDDIDEITFHTDGRMAIAHESSKSKNKQISCLDLVNRQVVFGPIDARSSDVVDLDFRPGGDVMASSSRKGVAHLWNAKTGDHIKSLETGSMYVLSVAFTPDGKYLATGTGSVKLWEMQDMVETIALDIHLVPIHAIEFAKDGSFLLSACHDKTVRIWRAPQIKK